jgi:hypothetical protein
MANSRIPLYARRGVVYTFKRVSFVFILIPLDASLLILPADMSTLK